MGVAGVAVAARVQHVRSRRVFGAHTHGPGHRDGAADRAQCRGVGADRSRGVVRDYTQVAMTSSVPHARHRYTYEEYLAYERDSELKHEYEEGEIVAMAGGSPRHSAL